MNSLKEPRPQEHDPEPEPSRLEEARRVIQEYANDLREIIKKLRKHVE
jgi:hypothetical protein